MATGWQPGAMSNWIFEPHQTGKSTTPTVTSGAGAALSGGGGGMMPSTGETSSVDNYWEKYHEDIANAITDSYKADRDKTVAAASSLLGKDYTGDLRDLYQEDLAKEQKNEQNQYSSYGMGELALRGDVQDQWADRRTSASSKAAIEGAQMQQNAYQTAASMISSATGSELDYYLAKLSAISQGSDYYSQIQSLLIPLYEKLGESGYSASDTGYTGTYTGGGLV